MKEQTNEKQAGIRLIGLESGMSAALLWLSQPPLAWWPLAFVALVPLIRIITMPESISKRGYAVIWLAASLYWLFSLQGLRHAHWAMYFCWMALAAYLAVYQVLFVFAARHVLKRREISLFLVIAVAWTGQECLRNYLLTGVSACMLGHAVADIPVLTQIADLFGSYGISFLIASVNACVYLAIFSAKQRKVVKGTGLNIASVSVMLGATILYGGVASQQPLGESLGTFALVQRSEPVEYVQSMDREVEIFRNYATESLDAFGRAGEKVDAVVWPESMFTGGNPWMMADTDAAPPPSPPGVAPLSSEDLQQGVAESRGYFQQRATHLLDAIRRTGPNDPLPHLILGSGVVHYREHPYVYSGVVNIGPDGMVNDWYGKTHLVMFGEYVPLIPYIPVLRSLVPAGLGVKVGPGPKRFQVGETIVSPNICIETAVERVTVNQMRMLSSDGEMPEVIVTVTNDGWFDDSSVIDHHRRCAQLVAVGCRRPILSAANNGPTLWIDSRGQVVEEIERGSNGVLFAKPQRDDRTSLYVRIGDWPARACALATLLPVFGAFMQRRRKAKTS